MTVQQSARFMQSWSHALRIEMQYPEFAPANHTVAFSSGGRKSLLEALDVCTISSEIGRDIVYIAFDKAIMDGPVEISLAIRDTVSVEWHPSARLYAASEDAALELLTDRHRWFVGPRNVLTAAPKPSKAKIAAGIVRAMRRWQHTAMAVQGVELTGSVLVPAGQGFSGAVSMDDVLRAA